jgi:hypothetical protein
MGKSCQDSETYRLPVPSAEVKNDGATPAISHVFMALQLIKHDQ